jgi:hypothetical protein
MHIILEANAIPERGTFQIHETVTIRISANEARRQVNQWLVDEVSLQMGAQESLLVAGKVGVWRVPVRWGAPPWATLALPARWMLTSLAGRWIPRSRAKPN